MKNRSLEKFQSIIPKLREVAKKMLLDIGDPAPIIDRAKHKPRVLVVGEFNTGKSSLVNSALGETALPTGVTPTTSLVTSLEKGPLHVNIKPLGTNDPIKIAPGKAEVVGYGIPDLGFNWQGFKELLTDPKNIDKIEQIQMTHPAMPEEIVLIDTPGVNDISKARAELVYGLLPTADIILFLISATKPFSESERVFLEERLLANDLKKIIFVLNRMDEIEPSERDELVKETTKSVTQALNKGFERVNALLGQTLYPPLESVQLFATSAKEMIPISGATISRSIGFELKPSESKGATFQNRELWKHLLELVSKERKNEVEMMLHHFLRRGAMRIRHAVDDAAMTDKTGHETMVARLKDNSGRIEKLRGVIERAERRIQEVEKALKADIHEQIDKAISDLASTFRLTRDPGSVNDRLKNLYEYIICKMKTTLDSLYAELGKEFDAILDEKRFLEIRKFELEYDFSEPYYKIMTSINIWMIASFFFGPTLGMVAGAAWFAGQFVSNKRSVKDYFMGKTVSEDTLVQIKNEIVSKTDNEIEYAVDFVRQSLVQKVDIIQSDVKNIVYSLTNSRSENLSETRTELEKLQPEINAFLVEEKP